MDFLGLTTLTVIDDALKLIERKRGSALDMSLIPLDDTETYEKVFHRALTSGVFQFESGGMRDVLRRYKPSCVEDLTALNALYRPGPIQGGMIDDFIERKWGRRVVSYELPELEALLKETLGVIVYQEQVMQIANVLAGYSLGEADLLRRAMGKKNPEEMAKQRTRFVEGAIKRKHPKDKVVRIFDLMEQFAGYGFNKSHSAAYALLAYHTAYLKTHYPIEFMAALLTSEISKPENVVKYIKECREMGISVEPPDVQISGADFTPSATGIRFGLTAIKNVGRNAIDSILVAREQNAGFPTLWEFCEKVDLRLMNKRVLESLIKAGALDCFGRRSQLIAVADRAMERAQQAQRDLLAGQHGLFAGLAALFEGGGGNGHKSADDLPNTPDWDENERLQAEKEVLGFFVSGHPLDKYAEKLRNLNVVDTATALEMKAPPPARRRNGGGEPENLLAIAGVIVGLKVGKSKRSGEMYAQAALEDTVGKIDLICFPKDYARLCENLKIEVPVLIKGVLRADDDESAPKLSVSSIQPLEDIKIKLPQNVRIRVLLESASEAMLGSLRAMITAAPGPGRLMINLESRGEYCVMLEPEGLTVGADRGFIERAEQLLGQGAVQAFE
jgi:DNA polymerase III subunit alpha